MTLPTRVQAQAYLYKRTAPGSVERIALGEKLLDAGFTPEDFERLNGEGEAEQQAALLGDVVAFVRRFVVLTDEQAVVVALWVVHAYAIAAFDVTGYLLITSGEKRSGKSRLLEVLKLLVPKPLHAIMPSEAVLFRLIDAGDVTLLLDEVDAFFGRNANGQQEGVRGILNAGFERGATVYRCTEHGKGTASFNVFCPKALAGIGDPPDTIIDRSFRIVMRRQKHNEKRERFRRRVVAPVAEALRERLTAFAAGHADELRRAEPAIPAELNDRAAEAAEPFLACADALGGAWPTKARVALVKLAGEGTEAESDAAGTHLLADLRDIFARLQEPEQVRSADLVRELLAIEGAPWGRMGWRKEPLEQADLAAILKLYGVRPGKLRFGLTTARGYLGRDLCDLFERYAPAPDGEPDLSFMPPPEQGGTAERTAPVAARSVPPPPEHTPEQIRLVDALVGEESENVPPSVPPPPEQNQARQSGSVPPFRGVPPPAPRDAFTVMALPVPFQPAPEGDFLRPSPLTLDQRWASGEFDDLLSGGFE